MSPVPRLISLVLVSGALVFFSARVMRWWLALFLTGLALVLLLPARPWLLWGSAMALCGMAGLARACMVLLRRPAVRR